MGPSSAMSLWPTGWPNTAYQSSWRPTMTYILLIVAFEIFWIGFGLTLQHLSRTMWKPQESSVRLSQMTGGSSALSRYSSQFAPDTLSSSPGTDQERPYRWRYSTWPTLDGDGTADSATTSYLRPTEYLLQRRQELADLEEEIDLLGSARRWCEF